MSTADPAAPPVASPRKWAILFGVGLSVFMSTLDGGIVQIAMPALMKIFHAGFPTVQWVALSYLMVLTSTTIGAARLGDLYGRKRLFTMGIVVFTLASLLCALAPGIHWLIALRALQGTGAVFMMSLGSALVAEAFPPAERGRALGIIGSVVSVGIALGPTLGGLLLGYAGWRWIFLVNLPVGIVAFWVVQRVVPASRATSKGEGFDPAGAVLLFLLLGAYTIGMTLGQRYGFTHRPVWIALSAAILLLPLFLRTERRATHPMLDLALLRGGLLGLNLLMGFLTFVLMGALFLLPFFLDLVVGLRPERAGLLLTVVPISMGVIAPWAGCLADRYGSRRISLVGLAVITAACLIAATLPARVTTLGYVVRLLPFGLGFGLFQSPNNRAIMQAAPRHRYGVASGLMVLSRTLGQITGIPLMASIFASRLGAREGIGVDPAHASPLALTLSLHETLRVGAGLAALAWLLAVVAWRRDRGAGD